MIIARSPLRICLGGGGTDLPSYYREHSGFLVSAAINKYVYITLHKTFVDEMIIKYSKMERVKSVDQIEHPIIRECLKLLDINDMNLEIASMADIHAGTGLGSSGSFTTALLKALHHYKRGTINAPDLAAQACHIELDRLKEPIGKQDQYIAAFGGITCFRFLPDDRVEYFPAKVSQSTLDDLEDHLLLFFTGFTRSASKVLHDQNTKAQKNEREVLNNLHFIKELGKYTLKALEDGDMMAMANLMNEHWQHKKKLSGQISSGPIDDIYDYAMKNGAQGGKLVGAGGGGFMLFYANDRAQLRKAMAEKGLPEVRFGFDYEGSKIIIQ
jgi:D-glycero-alpha-D-manno-heptose-7-phosphate kinase